MVLQRFLHVKFDKKMHEHHSPYQFYRNHEQRELLHKKSNQYNTLCIKAKREVLNG